MNNSNDPVNAPVETIAKQDSAVTPPVVSQQPKENSSPKKKTAVIVAAFLLVIVMLPVAYALGRMQSVIDTSNNISTGPELSPNLQPVEGIDNTADEVSDAYDGWKVYDNEAYGYSFKYPSDWQVEREVIQGEADWVSINPLDKAGSGGADAVAIHTYFDGTGCPRTKTKEFTVGEHVVTGTACVEDEIYKMSMKYSKTVGAGNGVILAVAAPNLVGIQVDTSQGNDETVQRILGSITGLTPYVN